MATIATLRAEVAEQSETGRVAAELDARGLRFYALDTCEDCGALVEGCASTGAMSVEGWSAADYRRAAGAELAEAGTYQRIGARESDGAAVCEDCGG